MPVLVLLMEPKICQMMYMKVCNVIRLMLKKDLICLIQKYRIAFVNFIMFNAVRLSYYNFLQYQFILQ